MPGLDLLLAFFTATVLFAYMPGPAMLYAAAQTLARGRWSGFMAAVGIHVGGYVHVLAAAAGLTVLFDAVPVLFTAVKLAGAAYLVWLGVSLIRHSAPRATALPIAAEKSARRAFLESVSVEVLNPKTAVFFFAFLPQFIDPSASWPVWLQFLALGTVVNFIFSTADLLCVALAGAVVDRLRRSSTLQRLTQRLGGGLLVALGVHLALQRY
jgi:threonine/homoserine/homoserine lactone efflux protein